MRLPRPAIVALLAIGFVLVSRAPAGDSAQAGQRPLRSGFIDIVAVDTDITNDDESTSGSGNTATEVGPIDECNTIANAGETLDVDVIADEVPLYDPGTFTGGLTGFFFSFLYDETVVKVIDLDADMLLAAIGRSPQSEGDPVPDTDGDFRVEEGDLSIRDIEDGEGVLARITIEAVGPGESTLVLGIWGLDGIPDVLDAQSLPHTINNVVDGRVAVGDPCSGSVGGSARFPEVEELPVDAADSSGGSPVPYAALAGGVAAVAALVAGGWYARRRWGR